MSSDLDNGFAWQANEYQLLDFGNGRKLERFGSQLLDRYSPAADLATKKIPARWRQALQVDRNGRVAESVGRSAASSNASPEWSVACGPIQFGLKLTPFGHVGLFPEQVTNWSWLAQQAADFQRGEGRPATALNLFAYTGGSTLALASASANVVHVDASGPAVTWARQNAEQSGMTQSPIRWIVEDARKFVSREVKRGNQYDIVVMDPPSFGHGPKGQRWEIEKDLEGLVLEAVQLVKDSSKATLLFTAHCEDPTPREIQSLFKQVCEDSGVNVRLVSERLQLTDESGRELDAGFAIRASC